MTGDRTIALERTFRAPRETVFRCWTEPELLKTWYSPVDEWIVGHAEVTPGVGGGYLVRFGPAPDGDAYAEEGTYRVFDAPARLVIEGTVAGEDMQEASLIEVRFLEEDSGTRVVVTETGLSAEAASEHEQGWQGCLDHLEASLAA